MTGLAIGGPGGGRTRSLTRTALAVLAVVVFCALAAYAALSSALPDRVLRAQLDAQFKKFSDGAVTLGSHEGVSLHPGGRIVIAKPRFAPADAGPARWRGSAESIEAHLRLLPLLRGHVEFRRLHLVRPDITFTDRTRLQPSQAQAAASFGTGYPDKVLQLSDGTIRLDDGGAERIILSGLDMEIAGAQTAGGVAIAAGFDAGMLHVYSELELDDLERLGTLDGTPGRILVDVTAAAPDAEDGNITEEPRDHAGSLNLGVMMRKLAASIGLPSLKQIEAEGRLSLTSSALAIEDATFSLGGLSLDGRLRVAVSPDQSLALRLRALQDETEAALAAAAKTFDEGDWTSIAVGTDWLSAVTLDLALTGEDLWLGGPTLHRMALGLSVANGTARLAFDGSGDTFGRFQSTAQLTGESGIARLTLASDVAGMLVHDTVDLVTRFAPDPLVGTSRPLQGSLTAKARADAAGPTLGDLVDTLRGTVTASLEDGSLPGADIITTLASLAGGREFMTKDKGPLIPSAGRTPFDMIDMRIDLASGTAELSRATVVGDRYAIDLGGAIALHGGAAKLAGNAILFNEARFGMDAARRKQVVDLPFGVGGTLFSPVFAAGVPTVSAKLDASGFGQIPVTEPE